MDEGSAVIIIRVLVKVIMILCIVIGMWHFGSGLWIYGKAHAATFLIENAWALTQTKKKITKPWSWADTWPVAELTIPAIGLREIVLSGDSGSSLAFGPGISDAGTSVDDEGVKLISGHRDTHFKPLQNIAINDEIIIKTPIKISYYRIKDIKIVDSKKYTIDPDNTKYDLMLATCYPFNSFSTGGTKRFLVQANRYLHP